MAIGTPAYYYSGYSPYGPMAGNSAGFEDASIVAGRNNNDAQMRQQDSKQDFQGQQAAYDRLFQQQQQDSSNAFKGQQSDYDRTFQGQQAQAGRDATASAQASQQGFQGTQAEQQRQFDAAQGDANRSLQQQLGLAPTELARDKFNTISPYVTNLLGGLSGQSGNGTFNSVGGSAGPQPQITAAPVYSQQQTDMAVNQAKATNAQQTATQNNALATKLAGSGFGSKSPLLASLQAQNQAAQMATDANAENSIRFGNSQANASQLLKGQTAQEGQWADYQDQDIRRRQNQLSGTSSLIAALGGLL